MLSDRHIQNRTGMADKVFQYECVILTKNMFEYFSFIDRHQVSIKKYVNSTWFMIHK